MLYGSPSHRPITAAEMTEWEAEYGLRAWEAEQANKNSSG